MHNPVVTKPAKTAPWKRWPFTWLALQNLGRRPTRAAVLALAVAMGVGTAFAALVVRQSIAISTEIGFGRMGADLLIVPKDTLVNVTPALLTVEPGPYTLPSAIVDEIARIPGVRMAAPQRTHRLAGEGSHGHDFALIAFDARRDFTVLPWIKEGSDSPGMNAGILVGARRPEQLGSTVTLAGQNVTICGRLALTGVGPFDRSYFASFETAQRLLPDQDSDRFSAVLVQLDPQTRPEQVRFALARMKDIKVVNGVRLVTSVRQFLSAVLAGVLGLTGIMLFTTILQIGVLYSAVLVERRQELGLLAALGAHRRQVTRMVLIEAGLTTGLGGFGGILFGTFLLVVFQQTMWEFLETLEVPLAWPPMTSICLSAFGCLTVAVLVGPVGVMLPAWNACRHDPYNLSRGGSS